MVCRMLFFALTFTSPSYAQTNDRTLEGVWAPSDQSAKIKFAPCGTRICGTLVSGKLKPMKTDMQGQTIVNDLVRGKNGDWIGRYVGDGNNIQAKVKLTSANTIDVKVCPVSFMCKTLKMTKVQ